MSITYSIQSDKEVQGILHPPNAKPAKRGRQWEALTPNSVTETPLPDVAQRNNERNAQLIKEKEQFQKSLGALPQRDTNPSFISFDTQRVTSDVAEEPELVGLALDRLDIN